jgi:dolichol-phosphate mannosyltransferase
MSDIHLHETELQDRQCVRRVVEAVKPDWVFHLAAYGAYSAQTGIERMVATNLLGCVALLDTCVEVGIESFVQTGSSSEYGYKDHAANEGEVVEPNSHYAVTKAAATHYCQFIARAADIHAVTVRLYSIYGPYEEPTRLIPTLVAHGLRGRLPPLVSPHTARDFVYVDEAVEAMLHVAAQPSKARGRVYNVCSGQQTTLGTLVESARKLMRIPVTPVWSTMQARSWDTDVWVGSPVLMEHEIGWRAKLGPEEGLKRTMDWLCEHPRCRQFYEAQIFGDSGC